MDILSRLLHPSNGDANNLKRKIDLKAFKRSVYAQSEHLAELRHEKMLEGSKVTLPKMGGPHPLQHRSNELADADRRHQLDKQELADTNKMNSELRKVIRKKSEELRKVQERYNDLLQEHKDDVGELTQAKKINHSLRESLRQNEADLRAYQKDMTELRGVLKGRQADLDQTTGLKQAAEKKAEQLRSELETTRGQLKVCKDDLFRLQPSAQLPDTAIVKDFESLCQDVISWIDMEISAFEKSYPNAYPGQIFSGGGFPEVLHLLEQFPTFGEYWVRYVVHRCLHDTMFSGSVYLLGLPLGVKQYLQAAEQRMARLEPPRGTSFPVKE